MTEKETRELIERSKSMVSKMRSGCFSPLDAAALLSALASELEATLWKPISDMPEDRFVLLHWPYWSKYPVLGVKSGDEIKSLSALSDYHIGDINGPTHYREITAPQEDDK